MNIVAHQDDDLLFMSPDVQRDLRAGHCVRTVYVTAGDAGAGEFYWLSREKGSEAAYSKMLGTPNAIWIEKVVRLSQTSFITIASPISRPGVTLLFMHLPDGNINGSGFEVSNFESLDSLSKGAITDIHSVDGESVYSVDGLEQALETLIQTYKPAEVRTQSQYTSDTIPDHSDHMAADLFATAAYHRYIADHANGKQNVSLKHYVGYPVRLLPTNVLGSELSQKRSAFMAYAKSDGSVCRADSSVCQPASVYASYLQREYVFNQ
jgi:LmbE family N-acetylglucosaminyl deacetylase